MSQGFYGHHTNIKYFIIQFVSIGGIALQVTHFFKMQLTDTRDITSKVNGCLSVVLDTESPRPPSNRMQKRNCLCSPVVYTVRVTSTRICPAQFTIVNCHRLTKTGNILLYHTLSSRCY